MSTRLLELFELQQLQVKQLMYTVYYISAEYLCTL